MTLSARFAPGELVTHQRFGYRGVIVSVDPAFSLSDEWYEQVALSRPPKDAPWYHVLVDQAEHATYVAERHLQQDTSSEPVEHPLIKELLGEFCDGCYQQLGGVH